MLFLFKPIVYFAFISPKSFIKPEPLFTGGQRFKTNKLSVVFRRRVENAATKLMLAWHFISDMIPCFSSFFLTKGKGSKRFTSRNIMRQIWFIFIWKCLFGVFFIFSEWKCFKSNGRVFFFLNWCWNIY